MVIKGSEIVRDWKPFVGNVWKAAVPNVIFGEFNPYKVLIAGDWFEDNGRPHHPGGAYLNGKSLWETQLLERVIDPQAHPASRDREGSTWTWFAEVDDTFTYLYANFHGKDPNRELVEINVRQTVFYPEKPGMNFLTVLGFTLRHAATPWAPPTAEQIGLIGTHWSKGWIIENNVVSDSRCSGITLGKYGDQWDNTSADSAEGYVKTIERATANGWNPESIGHHVVRHNTISDCEQTGICASLGAIFSEFTDNHIFNIWAQRQFGGAEMGGIKIHAAIDTLIARNRIHNTGRALWMDWMAQGTRITRNLCYDNTTDDLFVEVNHGPFLVDNNLFLSPTSLREWSEGGAFAHNLFGGRVDSRLELKRDTPYHPVHSTLVAGLRNIADGDNRFLNNVFVGVPSAEPAARDVDPKKAQPAATYGLATYQTAERPLLTGGNVYFNGASPYAKEEGSVVETGANPDLKHVEEGDHVFLQLTLGAELKSAATSPVTTARLGTTTGSKLGYENADGSPLTIDSDYFGQKRGLSGPTAGPFENPGTGELRLKVWRLYLNGKAACKN